MEQEERYDVDATYNVNFFGWDNNAIQQQQLARHIVPKIVERFRPKYVLDIGCGSGQWLDEYRKYKVRTRGIESASAAWTVMSEKTQKNVVKWDLRNKLKKTYKPDLVQSLEVAEHIEEDYADVFIYNLVKHNADIIFLTAATPEQHGMQHVNCQEKEYWMAKMKNNGYLFDQDILNEVLAWGSGEDSPDSPIWWSTNLMVFI